MSLSTLDKSLIGALSLSLLVNYRLVKERKNILDKETLVWSKLSRNDLLDVYSKVYNIKFGEEVKDNKTSSTVENVSVIGLSAAGLFAMLHRLDPNIM